MEIVAGIIIRALRIVLYGVEGIGKTLFASNFPTPLYIDLEQGTDTMDVRRVKPQTWEELLQIIKDVFKNPSICETLILDTGDRAEDLCIKYILTKYRKNGISDFPYGNGWVILREQFAILLEELDKLIAKGINVVILSHAQIKRIELPDERGSFDHYELKMSKNVSPLVKEWCDILLFANYKTYVSSEGNSHKASGGKRVMYSTHSPCWDAKNRHGLPDEMSLDYSNLAHLIKPTVICISPQKELKKKMEDAKISEEELIKLVAQKTHHDSSIEEYSDEFIEQWILGNWAKIVTIIKRQKQIDPSKDVTINNQNFQGGKKI